MVNFKTEFEEIQILDPLKKLRDVQYAAQELLDALDNALPKIDNIIAFQVYRSGRQIYDGPNLYDPMKRLREVLRD